MRAYVTGAAGFVGHWLLAHLGESGDDIVAVDAEVDVTSGPALRESMTAASPEVVYHLAGLAHVGRSWSDPGPTFAVNALGTLNVLEAAAACAEPPRVIVVSSAEVYGAAGSEPVNENAPLRPVSPYAASKVAAEFLGLQAYLGRQLPVIRVRPFNHVGPGQGGDFVVSALAQRIVAAERAARAGAGTGSARSGTASADGTPGTVPVGNLDAERDFTDVRDVVVAYRLLAESGEPGEVYNVASGRAMRVRDVAERLVGLASVPLRLEVDPELVRPVDVPVFLGDASRLSAVTGWRPVKPIDETLADVLEDWRERSAD